jgi:hypothetical protein
MKLSTGRIRLFIGFFLFLQITSCREASQQETTVEETQDNDDVSLPFNERLKKFIERELNIPQGEKYGLKLYEEHLNDDGKKDIIITVNRLEHAITSAESQNKVSKASSIGFFGKFNYVIYYSSITNKFLPPIPFGSTPQRELGISFENISSEKHKDLVVDYAIRNSQFRKVFLFMDDQPHYVFHWKRYDGWGTENELEAYCFAYGTGSYSEVKDIIINRAEMKNIGKDDDYDTIQPQINCTDILVKRFFYNTKDGKYYTPN